jgi:hypothetical protein
MVSSAAERVASIMTDDPLSQAAKFLVSRCQEFNGSMMTGKENHDDA